MRRTKSVVITSIGPKYILQRDKFFCQYWFEGERQPFVVKVMRLHEMFQMGQLKF
jgi:hypothetical protein